MRRWTLPALLALAALAPQAADAQQPTARPDRADRRVDRLMNRLRDELWSYRQELNAFQRAPEFPQLVDLRYQLRTAAIDLVDSRDNDPAAPQKARAMAAAARDLYRLTAHLEDRADAATRNEVRQRADGLKEHAVEIRVLVGRLHESMRLDFDDRPGDRR